MSLRGGASRILLLLRLELGGVAASGGFVAFTVFMLLPTLAAFYAAGLYWIPQSSQYALIMKSLGASGAFASELSREYLDAIKSLSGLVSFFWAGLPALLMASIVTSILVSGDLANGTLEVLATKPVRRYEIVLARLAAFVGASTLVILAAHTLNALIVSASFYAGLGASEILRGLVHAARFIAYYTADSVLFLLAATALTAPIAVLTRRVYLPVMAVLAYYIAVTASPQMLQGLMAGGAGARIARLLQYADLSHHARVVLDHWLRLAAPPGHPGYTASLTILVAASLALLALALAVLEYRDLA